MKLPLISQKEIGAKPIDWHGLTRRFMNPGELEALIALVRGVNPKGVLEIGVNGGRTAKAILDHVDGIECYQGIDVLPGYVPEKMVQRKEVPDNPGSVASHDKRFELILKKNGSLDLKPEDLKPCDAVFIDGDHGRKAVLNDTALAKALVRPGGIIIWHDYHGLTDRQGKCVVDVRDVLDEMHSKGEPILHVADTWLAFLRVPA